MRRPGAVPTFLLLFLLGCGGVEERCTIPAPQGPVVQNSGSGRWNGEVSFREVWRVGGLIEGQEFVQPAALAVSGTGQVAVADFGLAEVILIGTDGSWEGAVAVRGEGPGEVQAPVALTWTGEGRLLIVDIGLSRVVELDPVSMQATTTPIRPDLVAPVLRGGQVHLAAIQPDGTTWLELPGDDVSTGWDRRTFVRSVPGDTLMEEIAHSAVRVIGTGKYRYLPIPGWPRTLLGVGRNGWVLSDSTGRYELLFVAADGRVAAHVCHPAKGPISSPTERGVASEPDDRLPDDLLAALEEAPAPSRPAVLSRIVVDEDDRVWAQRQHPRPEAALDRTYGVAGAMHDLFDRSGHFLGSIRIPGGHRLQTARGNRIWTFEVGGLGAFSVVKLEMVRH